MQDELIRYHLRELDIAKNPSHPQHYLPCFTGHERVICDIGCGIGQSFIDLKPNDNIIAVGVDVTFGPLVYGSRLFKNIRFVNSDASSMPFVDGSFDFVFSRVALPYTNIPVVLKEMSRITCPGGKIWISLFSFSSELKGAIASILHLDAKSFGWRAYSLVNGIIFHFFSRLIPFPGTKKYRSFQSPLAIQRVLSGLGFSDIAVHRGDRLIVTAIKNLTH